MGEWKREKLGDISLVTKLAGYEFTKYMKYVSDGEIIAIRALNLRDGTLDLSDVKRIERSVSLSLPRSQLHVGDIVLSYTGTIGACAYINANDTYHLAPNVAKIEPRQTVVCPQFIFNYIRGDEFQQQLRDCQHGSTQPTIPMAEIRELQIPVPDLPTQRRIAAVLGALDDKIEVNRKICENLEAQAQALFKAWFVDDGSRVQATKQMQEVFDVTIGRTPPRKEFEWFSEAKDDNVTWASIADMGSCGMFLADSSEYLTPAAVQRFKLVMIPRGTVLLSFKLTVGRVAIADVDMVSNEAIAHLRTDNTAMREYLYCYLKQYDFDTLGSTSSIATAVNSTTIKEMPFRVPTDAALVDFHNVAKPIFDLIRSKSQEARALAAMRDALLPKLMSGELAVEKVEVK